MQNTYTDASCVVNIESLWTFTHESSFEVLASSIHTWAVHAFILVYNGNSVISNSSSFYCYANDSGGNCKNKEKS